MPQRRDSLASVSGCKLPVAVPATRRYFVQDPPSNGIEKGKRHFSIPISKEKRARERANREISGRPWIFRNFFETNGGKTSVLVVFFFRPLRCSLTDGAGHVHRPSKNDRKRRCSARGIHHRFPSFFPWLVLVRRPAEEAIKSSRMASKDDAYFFHKGEENKIND